MMKGGKVGHKLRQSLIINKSSTMKCLALLNAKSAAEKIDKAKTNLKELLNNVRSKLAQVQLFIDSLDQQVDARNLQSYWNRGGAA